VISVSGTCTIIEWADSGARVPGKYKIVTRPQPFSIISGYN
jgi:hypothetical protein